MLGITLPILGIVGLTIGGIAAIRGNDQDNNDQDNNDQDNAVSVKTGSSLTAFITSEFPTPPDRSFALIGYESASAEDLDELGLDPTDTAFGSPTDDELGNSIPPTIPPTMSPGETARAPLIGRSIVQWSSGSLTHYLIPGNSGAVVGKALCDAVTNSSRVEAALAFDAELDSGPKSELSCEEDEVRVGFASPSVPPTKVTTDDWELLRSMIVATGADRLVVQSADQRLTTLAEAANALLGTNATDDNRRRLIEELNKSGSAELPKAPTVIAFTATGPQQVQIFSVFPTDDAAETARVAFTRSIPNGELYSRTPVGGGGVVASRQGRVLVFDCPNSYFTPKFAYSPGTFPTFFVAESER